MPWNDLPAWYARVHDTPRDAGPTLTMVTLRTVAGVTAADVDWHRDTEFGTLVDWAKAGFFVLGFTAVDRAELTLFCALEPDEITARVAQLPLVAAGLAHADIRAVSSLRLTRPLELARG
ncbi:hypothetical protein [Glacieibacterium frigidum]|uniref:Uncharacterized protein n=1 Tax=Glacieibacterium frigidum TaxID=2593303 RepID=A0A552UH40_9SPHN|nr:hypothetical protein [Glacieibacterium frigidum]TRW17539.1 hypothetical protein FMM06_05135 [Glacieibacterium frigidum]